MERARCSFTFVWLAGVAMLMRPMTLRNGVHIGRRFVVLQGTGVRAIAYEHVPRRAWRVTCDRNAHDGYGQTKGSASFFLVDDKLR